MRIDSLSGGADEIITPSTVYSYSIPAYNSSSPSASGYDATGNIISFNDSVMGSWSYQYDSLNRVVNGHELSSGPTPGWSGCFAYDAWGNRTGEAYSATGCGDSPAPTVQAQYNTANRITETDLMPTGYVYDAAGNATNDGVNQYAYDNEERICAVHDVNTGTVTGYIYDADGNDVAQGSLTSFSCEMATNGFSLTASYALGKVVSAFDGSNNWQYSNVYAEGKLLGVYINSPSELNFVLTD